MKKVQTILFFLACAIGLLSNAHAYEYRLQLPIIPRAQGMTSIGDQYNADGTVSGSITYFTQSCNRACAPRQYFCGATGTWDGQGNLLSSTPYTVQQTTPCTVPAPIATRPSPLDRGGLEEIYATSGPSATGFDNGAGTSYARYGFGFIDTPASHFTWQSVTPSCQGVFPSFTACQYVINDAPFDFVLTLASDGDFPLNVGSAAIATSASGYYTVGAGTGTLAGNTCQGAAPGSTCTVTVHYDPNSPTPIKTGSPQGYAYTALSILLNSDAGNLPSWSTRFTITGVSNGGGDD
jgi:hypothetical protein